MTRMTAGLCGYHVQFDEYTHTHNGDGTGGENRNGDEDKEGDGVRREHRYPPNHDGSGRSGIAREQSKLLAARPEE